ncbi:helix-turn-helix domain-containing protein [Anaerospora hongkongensis]|uniref:helix-turn-helix domain-containing protein n=1 Tax=Anaerospora hongkongensis TaxID=244830 RepID=UPI00289649EC|nr:helix-turn-helix transcriptional regulator [Anaerospora hongkongensis]
MDFSSVVIDKLKNLNMTKSELAKKMGYSSNYISDLLARERRWNETTTSKACEILELEVQYVDKPSKKIASSREGVMR